ncbi:envelope stress response membrane protein PspB [Marinobacterium arenosum]|uniref:envelope stress response membrane protein PspB n=1 Tax=Marinobacterium arenosum TaxID=2862496 RepID=UPI001C950636|nr:envelope stress response membrane protein PspB [Marinobacterium arenosum]MBY4676183.1 envelope stress response membrane protein PspB [Marinobacterium arenosum]
MSGLVFFFVPTVIFMGLVAPLWLLLHYLSKSRAAKGLSAEDRQELEAALAVVDKLEDRIQTLEAILDADHPGWRQQQAPRNGAGGDYDVRG